MNDVAYERVQMNLERLRLTRIGDHLDGIAEEAARQEWTYLQFLDLSLIHI